MQRVPRLVPSKTSFFICDVQERFRDIISNFPTVIRSAKMLIGASVPLDIPVLVTEQYPRAFGHTVSELNVPKIENEPVIQDRIAVFPKTKFSMLTDNVIEHGSPFLPKENPSDHSIVLCGIETHVCVQQTTFDLLERGYNVHILADGVSSCNKSDRIIAIDALRQAGAFITSTESVLFELMRDSKHPKFKELSSVIKEERVETGLI